MIKLLALDLGVNLGVCKMSVYRGSSRVRWVGTLDLSAPTREETYESLLRQIDILIGENPDVVAWEDVRHFKNFTYIPFIHGYLCGRLGILGIPFVGVNVSELKLWATGRGGASKEEMIIEACRRYISLMPELESIKLDENMADAFLVAAWAMENSL